MLTNLTKYFSLIFFLFFLTNYSWANLLITPNRVVIEGNQRSKSVILINTSNQTSTYQLHWTQKRQMPDGRFTNLPPESDEVRKASSLLKFSPHQFTLSPNKKQTVRIILKDKKNLKKGEFRSHLTFQPASDLDKNDYPFNMGPPQQNQLQQSFSIPVTIRQGKINASANITSINLRKTVLYMGKIAYNVKVTLSGTGENTAIGRLKALWKNKMKSEFNTIGASNNIVLYPESNSITFQIHLNIQNLSSGYMKITYEGTGEFLGTTFSELEIPVTLSDFKFENLE